MRDHFRKLIEEEKLRITYLLTKCFREDLERLLKEEKELERMISG